MGEKLFDKIFTFVVILLLLVISIPIITISDNISNTIYVDDDNITGPWDGTIEHPYRFIQQAIDNATNGDTIFVYSGIYRENINFNKSLSLIGEDKNTTIIHGYLPGEEDFSAIVLFPVNNATISGFTIENATTGIAVHSMYHKNANNCSISNIIFKTKGRCGVDIFLEGSTNMKIHDNIMNHGIYISNSFNNLIERNIVGDKPLVYLENKSNQTITNAGQVILNLCENITVMNLNISNVYCGIQLYESDYSYIYNNSLYNNCFGINIHSKYNIIERNTIKSNDCGILLQSYKWNKIFHNNFINNSNNAEGFFSSNNLWYDPLTKTGNYWSDYNGTDNNRDGIGDIPYNVWENEQDLYPLIHPWNESTSPFVVYVDDNYDSSTPGWGYDRFNKIQDAIDAVSRNGIVYVYNGTYYEHILINKTIDLIGENRDAIIDGNYTGDVVNITANGVSIEEFTIIHGGGDWQYNAVEVYHSDNITISNLNIYLNNGSGINLYFSNNSIIYNCNISDSGVGIHLPYSPDTVIDSCIITNCDSGINVSSDANHTKIINCSIYNNSYFGIFLAYAEGFIITNCEIKYNDVGIAVWPCNLSIIKNCHISNNEYGIYIPSGNEIGGEKYNYNNKIYLNSFINNTYNVYSNYSNSSSNIWNSPSKITYIYNGSIYTNYLGNYWSDYNGTDGDDDGIGDTPYNISIIGEDIYPLIKLFESYTISNRPPIANFTFDPMEPIVGETVIFNASTSYDIDGIIVNYTWFFSNDSIGYGMITPHVFTESGIYNVTLQVTDDKGWINNTTKLIVVLPPSDILPPSTTLLVGNPNYGGNWVTSHTIFNLTAVDNLSGVNETYYRIWCNGSWMDWIKYNGTFSLTGEGKHYLEYYSIDNAGNNETIHNKTFYVDNTPPITTLSIGSPSFEYTTIYVTSDTNFYLSSHDKPSLYNVGFNNTYYRIWSRNNGWSNWMIYQSSFTVTISGEHYIEYYSIDHLGNIEDIHNTSFYVDNIPPTTNGYGYYPIHLDSKDIGVGFYSIHYRYRVDNNSWSEWFIGGLNENITLWISNDNKSIYVDYYAVDILGNIEDMHHDVFKILREPHVDFSYSKYGKNVYFNASPSYDEDGSIIYYNWSFGDGKYGYGIKVNHSYPTYDTYNVTLTVTDDDGLTSNITKNIHLVDNIPPDVTYISVIPIQQKPGGYVNISAEIIDDSGLQEVQLILTYPSGELKNISIKDNKSGFNIYYYNHTYTDKGEYSCYFWVIDIYGNIGISDTRYFEIEEELVANIDAPNNGWLNMPVYFHGSASGGKPPYSYHWDFGDGNNSTGQNPIHIYTTTGIYTVTLTVEDSRYITARVTKTITIMRDNTPPTIHIIKPSLGIYYKNKLFTNFLLSIVIGDIDIEVEVSDIDTGIERVEFYIDNVLKTTITSPPYIWNWDEKNEYWFKHIHTIETIAYDKAGNSDSDTIVVWRFH